MTETKDDVVALEEITGCDILTVLETLPKMGRVMIIAKTDRGVTHERIGPVEDVSEMADGSIRLSGTCQDSLVDTKAAVKIQIDRSSVMKGQIYPHLKFLDDADEIAFAVVGMDGAEQMDEALVGFTRKALENLTVNRVGGLKDSGARPEVPETDAAMIALNMLCNSGEEVTITGESAGLTQVWKGKIETVRPSMGFVNVMTPDFHLHLKAGSVFSWLKEPGRWIALDASGQKCGLRLDSVGLA